MNLLVIQLLPWKSWPPEPRKGTSYRARAARAQGCPAGDTSSATSVASIASPRWASLMWLASVKIFVYYPWSKQTLELCWKKKWALTVSLPLITYATIPLSLSQPVHLACSPSSRPGLPQICAIISVWGGVPPPPGLCFPHNSHHPTSQCTLGIYHCYIYSWFSASPLTRC